MPSYVFTAPDGRKIKVNGPEGSTPEQAFQIAQGQYQPEQKPSLAQTNPAEYDPNSQEFQDQYGPTAGMSGAEKFFAGAGKSVVDIGRGLRQLNPFGSAEVDAEVAESRQLDAPLMQTGAGIAGNVAGTLATTVMPVGLAAKGAQAAGLAKTAAAGRSLVNPTTFKAAAAVGALQGGIQPTVEGESRAMNTGVGAVTGLASQGVFAAGARAARPVKNVLGATGRKAVKVLEDAGVPLDAAQKTGSRTLKRLKASLFDNPVTAGKAIAKHEQQQSAFARAVLKTIGQDADAATPDVMDSAAREIGQVFDDVAARNPVKYDNKLEAELVRIGTQAMKELESPQAAIINNQINEVIEKASTTGTVDGAAYQNIKEALDRISMGQSSGLGHWARELRGSLDDALERSAQGGDFQALKEARKMWRRMLQIQGSIDKDGSGTISPARLANSIGVKKNASQAIRGGGDQELVKLAQAGKQILSDRLPNSGTPARLAALLAPGAVVGGAAGLASGDLETAAYGVAGGVIAPKLIQNALSRQYLSQGMQGMAGNALMLPQQNALAGALLKQTPIVAAPLLTESVQ